MRRALRLAARGLGKTSPNPMVGAVVVKGGKVVGTGYHHRAGEPHAEVLALRGAGRKARGATLYLNLEPCNHFGRTPPCTETVIKSGIKRVVAGMKDPNPLVAGKGIRRLRRAGIRVDLGILESECRALNSPFSKFITTKTPYVILKTAASLDGRVASKTGDSRWISGEASRLYVHRLRSTIDAVVTGIGTVLKDNPMLNARLPGAAGVRHPLRVVVDSRLRIPLRSQIVRTAREYRTLVATTAAAPRSKMLRLEKAGVKVVVLPSDGSGRVNLSALMKELGRREIVSALLEAGPALNAKFLEEKLVDRLVFFIAPKLIGGEKAYCAIGGEGIERVRDAGPVRIEKVTRSGEDILIEGVPAK